MRYAIFFQEKDERITSDSFTVDSASERDMKIKQMKRMNIYGVIAYEPIYADGEYGCRKYAVINGEPVGIGI